jgi:arginase
LFCKTVWIVKFVLKISIEFAMSNKRNVIILENPSELGAGTRGASLGPQAVRLADAARGARIFNRIDSVVLQENNKVLSKPSAHFSAKYIDTIETLYETNMEEVENQIENNKFPLLISGDHSNALMTIAALRNTAPDKRLGVIWIDAHADLHSPFTSPTGNMHGMPLGASLGEGYMSSEVNEVEPETAEHWHNLTHLGSQSIHPKINPQDLVFVDIRDLEEQEWKDIDDNKIKCYLPARIFNKKMQDVAEACLTYLEHCDHIYVSFDVDSMDPSVSVGTGTSVDNGLSLKQAKKLLKSLWESEKLACLEITEVNPLLDQENRMAEAVVEILDEVLSDT